MANAVTVYEAKTQLSRILAEVERGSEYIVTKNGVPCAKVVPIRKPTKVPLGFVKGRVTEEFFEPLPAEELEAWEGGPTKALARKPDRSDRGANAQRPARRGRD